MKKLMISMLLASPATILAMENNTIQADESTPLLNNSQYERNLEAGILDCCSLGFLNQKYQHMKEEREVDFQLKMAEKKRQLATIVASTPLPPAPVSNVMRELPAPLPAHHEAPCANCSTGVDNFCHGVAACAVWTACFPCMCFASYSIPESSELIKKMELKKRYIETAASLGYHEDPRMRTPHDKSWEIYEDRYVRISKTNK
jgi:hypothetical protein